MFSSFFFFIIKIMSCIDVLIISDNNYFKQNTFSYGNLQVTIEKVLVYVIVIYIKYLGTVLISICKF